MNKLNHSPQRDFLDGLSTKLWHKLLQRLKKNAVVMGATSYKHSYGMLLLEHTH